MTNKFSIVINKKIKKFDKLILVEGDKSISHRALLIASQCLGTSVIKGLLESEDVKNTIVCLKKLGVKIFKNKNRHIVCGNGFGSFKKPKNNELYMGNSGTLARLILGIIATHPNLSIKISGDTSLNKRDMDRVIRPLSKIGCNFYPKNKKKLPLKIVGTEMPLAQYHYEKIGSAQVKSSILLAALNTPGITKIKEEKKSRDHTEKLLKFINADIKVKKMNSKNLIAIKGEKNLKSFNLKVPGDPSSAAPFIVLTLLTKGAKLVIKNINCNPTRIGFIKILKKMNANIKIKNLKKICGEPVGSLHIKSSSIKSINCPKELVPYSIDEFPLLFVVASHAKGISKFNGINELRHKESDRIKKMEDGLNKIGIKTKSTKDSIRIYGNPNIKSEKNFTISPEKDHRIAMSFFCYAQLLNSKITINNFETVNTSFSKFLEIMKKIGAKFEIKKKS
tara:strand:+ start:73 stop:1422 length:1350 start_codon:yes stop_codon:yes gene_type:complete